MKLNYREYGRYRESQSSLIFLHGLLGSAINWHGIARAFESDYHILVPDLRNHGQSPHSSDVSYQSMALDVAELLDDQGLESATFIGHSMGGKVAMWLALSQPHWVDQLVVVDIAPVSYPNRFGTLFSALQSLDLGRIDNRQHADQLLSQQLEERGLRQYLLQNLVLENAHWSWRVNLNELARKMPEIIAFPSVVSIRSFLGETLFVYGGNSDYVSASYHGQIKSLFPYAKMRSIAGAGHWVYAEQPELFGAALQRFFDVTQ